MFFRVPFQSMAKGSNTNQTDSVSKSRNLGLQKGDDPFGFNRTNLRMGSLSKKTPRPFLSLAFAQPAGGTAWVTRSPRTNRTAIWTSFVGIFREKGCLGMNAYVGYGSWCSNGNARNTTFLGEAGCPKNIPIHIPPK